MYIFIAKNEHVNTAPMCKQLIHTSNIGNKGSPKFQVRIAIAMEMLKLKESLYTKSCYHNCIVKRSIL